MEEENKIKVQDNTQPEPETPDAKSVEPNVAEVVADVPVEKPKKSRAPVILTIILALLLIGSVVAYFLIFNQPKNDGASIKPSSDSSQSKEETEDETETLPESEISDSRLTQNLFDKVLILHSVNGSLLENKTELSANLFFEFAGSIYGISDNLYVGGLSESDKFFIATNYMRSQGLFKSLSNYDLPADFISSRPMWTEYCSKNAGDKFCTNEQNTGASESEVASVYRELFGSEPESFVSPTSRCGAASYNSEYRIYYNNIAGCGGNSGPTRQAYVEKFTGTENEAFVYLRLATIDTGNSDNVPVYKTFFSLNELRDADSGEVIIPDESLIYTRLGSGGFGMIIPTIITSENYTEFEQFRFVFEKSGEKYYFKTVEKL
ncbi:hypothetical protein IKE71_04345 [Candidatus Saccharibacteria bacterium]|nr:hypothetical protein [Candidatus Saccharibacteria bacterium]